MGRQRISALTETSPMPFGKHKGERMEYVPADYLLWLWDKIDLWNRTVIVIDAEFAKFPDRIVAQRRLVVHDYIAANLAGIERCSGRRARNRPLAS